MGNHHLTVAGDRCPVVGLADNHGAVKIAHQRRHGHAVRPVDLVDALADHLGRLGVAMGDQFEGLGGAAP